MNLSKNRSASSPCNQKALPLSVSFNGWRYASVNFKSWARKMTALHEPTWRKAGIFEAVTASTAEIHKDTDLVLGVAEKWCPDTNTFVFSWGETTITLEDVMVLLGFSVLGLPVFATLDSSEKKKILKNLESEWKIMKEQAQFITQVVWMRRFMDSGDELEHAAFLSLWLSYFVFPSCYYHISDDILHIAVHLSSGTRIAIAPAVLAHLYSQLTLLKTHIRDFTNSSLRIDLSALFKLVQVWTWERFKELQPKPVPLLNDDQPRLDRWHDVKHRSRDVRQILEKSKIDSFVLRPYTKTVENWKFPLFYPQKGTWVPVVSNLDDQFISFVRCIKVSELVGIDCVEHYFPNRVASQFGLFQDVPAPLNRNSLSQEADWNDYDKSIEDLTLYIPSRSATPRVTPMFCEWWRKTFSKLHYLSKENQVSVSAQTSKSRNLVGDYINTSNVPSDSKVNITCLTNKKRKCQTQVLSDNDEEDDSLTIAQAMRLSKKKYCKPLGNNDSGHCRRKFGLIYKRHKHMKQARENDESSMGCFQKQIDDANSESNAGMVDGGGTEPECLVHGDGAMADEKARSIEAEMEDNVVDGIKESALKADNNEGCANGCETSKARESFGLTTSDESNIHITKGDGSLGHGFLLLDNGIGSEETMNAQLEDLEKRNDKYGEEFEKSYQEAK